MIRIAAEYVCAAFYSMRERKADESHERPEDEQEVIADIFHRMDEIQERLEHERRQRKKPAKK